MKNSDWLDSPWSGFFEGKDQMKNPTTGISEEVLEHIGKAVSTPPEGDFVIHGGTLLFSLLLCFQVKVIRLLFQYIIM